MFVERRKPSVKVEAAGLPAAAQIRKPHTVYFTDAEWAGVIAVARRKLLEPSPFVRIATNRVVRMLRAQGDEEASFEMAEGWR
jgi:hypothetical protein